MVFSSIPFLFYFAPAFFFVLFLSRNSNTAILLGSVLFYTWGDAKWLPVLATSVIGNFYAARWIEASVGRRRWIACAISITGNLLPLFYFKYSQFAWDNISSALGRTSMDLGLTLPLGISFFTFQSISYLIDVYRRNMQREGTLRDYAAYIFLFPHLIAGPIVRYSDIHDELKVRTVGERKFALGLQYFIVGLCQKVIIANTLARAADYVFALKAGAVSTLDAWVGSTAYMFQLYFDFCGYSNMAIGLAFMMGFHFPRNFNYPYVSRSISEFWRRWHMSLSFWFRDYVYLPLGGSRVPAGTIIRNVLFVFLLTGLWHGAAWTFIVWGLYHGLFVLLERFGLGALLKRLPLVVQHAYALLIILVGWVIFRSHDLSQAGSILAAMAGRGSAPLLPLQIWFTPEVAAALLVAPILSIPTLPWLLSKMGAPEVEGALAYPSHPEERVGVRLIPAVVLVLGFGLCVLLLAANTLNPFLYFRF